MPLKLKKQGTKIAGNPIIIKLNSPNVSGVPDTHISVMSESKSPEFPKTKLQKRKPVDFYGNSTDATASQKSSTKRSKQAADLKEIYLQKNIKPLKPVNLETIFEEPKVAKSKNIVYTESKKKKRFLLFDPQAPYKQKKRQTKMKKVFGRKKLKLKSKPMDTLLKKLNTIE